jgi:ADP-ribose pyrophosphatase YjhB (NUDIX family)
MSSMSPRQRAFAAAIIEQTEGLILICRPRALDSARRAWVFPRTEVRPGETPEAAVRRATREGLGLDVEISVGQPR